MKKILLASPVRGGLSTDYVRTLIALLNCSLCKGPNAKYSIEFAWTKGTSVAMARDEYTDLFLKRGDDELLQWDTDLGHSDVGVMLSMFERLLSHDVDIVAAPYVGHNFNSQWHGAAASTTESIREDGLIAMAQIPIGFSKVKRRVFEKIKQDAPWLQCVFKDTQMTKAKTGLFEFYPNGIVGPTTGQGKVERIKELLKTPLPPNHDGALGRYFAIETIINDSDYSQNIMLGEDYYFPVAPDTKVLDANWRWTPLHEIPVGTNIMGVDETSPRNSSRRMRVSQIQHIVKRLLPEYRIVTESRELRTTAEHPWLAIATNKNVAKTRWNWIPTAKLSAGAHIARVVPVVASPDITSEDYMRGYIQGLIQSDGTRTAKGAFSVRMCDTQPLERFSTFLATLGIESLRRAMSWHDGNPNHRRLHGVSVGRSSSFKKLASIVDVTDIPSPLFAAGYLAGMYDGDGNYSGTTVNIAQMKDWKKDRLEDAGKLIGFNLGRTPKLSYLTGTENFYKFWMSTSPSLNRKMLPIGQIGNDGIKRNLEVKHTPERVLSIEATGHRVEMWCPTTTSGTFIADGIASHNCKLARDSGFELFIDNNLIVPHESGVRLPVNNQKILAELSQDWRLAHTGTPEARNELLAQLKPLLSPDIP